jgi:hypothetical protein
LNLALVLVAIVMVFLICNLPRLLLNVLEFFQFDTILRWVNENRVNCCILKFAISGIKFSLVGD